MKEEEYNIIKDLVIHSLVYNNPSTRGKDFLKEIRRGYDVKINYKHKDYILSSHIPNNNCDVTVGEYVECLINKFIKVIKKESR